MFKVILEKASKQSKVLASKLNQIKTIKPNVLKDFKFNGESFKSQFYMNEEPNNSQFGANNQSNKNYSPKIGLFGFMKDKISSFWSSFSGKLLISESDNNKRLSEAPKASGPLKVVMQTIKSVVLNFSRRFDLIKIKSNFNYLIRVNDWLPVLVNQASSKYMIVRNVTEKQYLIIRKRAQAFIARNKDNEKNRNFKNYLIKFNSNLDKKSKELQKFKESNMNFGYLQRMGESIKKKASTSDMFSIFSVNVGKMNSVLRSDGWEKKFHMYKLKFQKILVDKIYPMSMMNKIKLALIVLLALSVLSFAGRTLYNSHRSRKLDSQIAKAYNLVEEVKKQNEEISRNNDSLRLFLEREKYKNKGFIEGNKREF